jgi:hypothetical protein
MRLAKLIGDLTVDASRVDGGEGSAGRAPEGSR